MLHALGVAAAVIISFSAILIRLADVSPSTAAFFRPLYALPVVLVLYLVLGAGDRRSLQRRVACVLAGALMGMSFTLWNYAIGYVGAGLATVLGNTQVIFVALIASLWLRQPLARATVTAAPLVFAGVVLSTGIGRPDAYGAQPGLGVLFSLVNAATYAAFLIIFHRAAEGPPRPAGPLLEATFGAVVTTFALGLLTDPAFDLRPHLPAHAWLVLLGLGSQVLGWWLILTVLPRLPALDVSVILLVQPVLTVVWGRLLFAELLSPLQWAGVGLVLAGITAMTLGRARAAAAERGT